mmetsp:Transcript_31491/g.67860  ORF Transcript_31491/g.67860 Transcript_31491/m.67860 type:complete len:208 (-) Transcript_31491:849-1472(-)
MFDFHRMFLQGFVQGRSKDGQGQSKRGSHPHGGIGFRGDPQQGAFSKAVPRRHFVHRAHAGDLNADPAVLQDKEGSHRTSLLNHCLSSKQQAALPVAGHIIHEAQIATVEEVQRARNFGLGQQALLDTLGRVDQAIRGRVQQGGESGQHSQNRAARKDYGLHVRLGAHRGRSRHGGADETDVSNDCATTQTPHSLLLQHVIFHSNLL